MGPFCLSCVSLCESVCAYSRGGNGDGVVVFTFYPLKLASQSKSCLLSDSTTSSPHNPSRSEDKTEGRVSTTRGSCKPSINVFHNQQPGGWEQLGDGGLPWIPFPSPQVINTLTKLSKLSLHLKGYQVLVWWCMPEKLRQGHCGELETILNSQNPIRKRGYQKLKGQVCSVSQLLRPHY